MPVFFRIFSGNVKMILNKKFESIDNEYVYAFLFENGHLHMEDYTEIHMMDFFNVGTRLIFVLLSF